MGACKSSDPSCHNLFDRVCTFQDERTIDEIDQVIQQAQNDIDLLPEINRSAIDRLERYKSELAVVEQSVKKHKMKVDKLSIVVKKTHVSHYRIHTVGKTLTTRAFAGSVRRSLE